MRQFFALLLPTFLFLFPATAQPVRVVTWDLDEVSTPSGDPANAEADDARLRQIAAALKPAKADVILLYGLRDGQMVRKLADYLKQPYYHSTGPSTLRKNGPGTPFVGRPLAVFSRKRSASSRTVEWRMSGNVELPGGFKFVTFPYGSNALSVYSVHWPENAPTSGTNLSAAAFAEKRELAVKYLLHHSQWIASTMPTQRVALYLTGDINADAGASGRGAVEQALAQAGFTLGVADGAKDRLLAAFTNTPAMLNPVFLGGMKFAAAPELVAMKGFLDPVLVSDVTFKDPEAPAPAPLVAVASAPPPPPPASRFVPDRKLLWWTAGGVALVLLGVVVLRTWRDQFRSAPLAVSRRTNDALVVELSHRPPTSAEVSLANAEASRFAGSVTETGTGQTATWQTPPLRSEMRPTGEAAGERAGLMPHLSRLMREKLFVWLSSQRSQLLDSHETGTKQVLSLEERLERIQGQFQQRLIAQEGRITELEKDVQAKEKIIRSFHQQPTDGDDASGGRMG